MTLPPIAEYVEQFLYTMRAFPRSWRFLREHRLWEGLTRYGWISKMLVAFAFIISLRFITVFLDWWNSIQSKADSNIVYGLADLSKDMWSKGLGFLVSGGMKYVVLFLFMVIIYHISNRAMDVLTGQPSHISLKDFIDSQKRALGLTITALVLESITILLLKIFFGIFDFISPIQPVLVFAVKAYWVGFVVVDSYQEQFGLTIKQSNRFMSRYIGVGLAIGVVFKILMFIPVFGTVIASFVTTVTAVIVMHELAKLHLVEPGQLEWVKEEGT
jgi:hypothetical protein